MKTKTENPNDKPASASVIVFPLFGQRKMTRMDEEELEAYLKKQRNLIRQHSSNRGLRAMFNMVERMTARLQSDGVQSDADKHAQGMACGAEHIYKVLRAVLEGTEEEDEDDETEE